MNTDVARDFSIGSGPWGVLDDVPRPPRKPVAELLIPTVSVGSVGLFMEQYTALVFGGNDPSEVPTIALESGRDASWLDQVYSLVAAERPDEAIDELFDHIDDLLLAGDFSACDDLLSVIDPKRLDTNLLVAALSITKPAASRLPTRVHFVERIEKRLRELAPLRLEALVAGLR